MGRPVVLLGEHHVHVPVAVQVLQEDVGGPHGGEGVVGGGPPADGGAHEQGAAGHVVVVGGLTGREHQVGVAVAVDVRGGHRRRPGGGEADVCRTGGHDAPAVVPLAVTEG